MTPLELTLEGFTVYRQHTVIDFSGADTALFAVTGPTGAGKSTLLDAITYVLYGKTARLGARGLGGMISPGSESLFAQLTFRTARGVYRATRAAQRRGGSVGTEVRLEEADESVVGGWRQLSDSERVKEANQALEDIVGLDYEGFTRAVLLPQGAFDEFLRGDASLRRQLLSSLLGLDKVESIQRLASSRASELKGEAEARRTLLSTEYQDLAPEALKRMEGEVEALSAAVEADGRAARELEERLGDWRESARLFEERVKLQERRTRLRAAATRVSEVRTRAEAAQRAAGVTPYAQQVEQAEGRASRAEAAVKAREQELAVATQGLEQARAAAEATTAAGEATVAALTAEVEVLQEVLPLESALTERGGALSAAAGAERTELLDPQQWHAWSTAATLVTPFERALAAHATAVNDLQRASAGLAALETQVASARTELQGRLEEGKRLREAETAAKAELERARRADLAAALRAGLAPGDPCPVCGGTVGAHDHGGSGAPAEHTDAFQAANQALDAATAALEAALKGYEAARNALTRQEADLTNAQERRSSAVEGVKRAALAVSEAVHDLEKHGVTPAVATGAPAEDPVLADVAAVRYEAGAGQRLRAELTARQSAALAAHAAAVLQRLQDAGLQLEQQEGLRARLERRRRELEAERSKAEEHKKRLDGATKEVDVAQARLSDATEAHAAHVQDLKQAQAALVDAATAAGFSSPASAAAAALPPAELQALEAEVRAHEQEAAQVDQRDVELAALLAERQPLPDAPAGTEAQLDHARELIGAAQTELRERQTALEANQQRLGAERGRLQQARERLKRSVELRRELKELEDQHALYHQLNTDLHGNRFPEHLLTQVQQVLARRASAILQLVTDGRYDLRLEAGDYLVADAWAGGELRSARTLSGGESFVASLALALALSDTLAGSAALGALFLDEGFGTLDRVTLDAVTAVLESLTTEGRMVGVITHVPELSARLPARLVVTKGPGGSTVAWDT